MTMRRETCTCGAARPAPSWSSMVSNMSSIRRWISGAPLAASWAALVLDGVWQTRREHAARARLGPVVLRAWQPSVAAGLAVLVASLAGAVVLEGALGRFAFRPAAALA